MTLVIVALITGGAVRGFRSLAKSDLRAGTAHLSGAIRYLFDRASTTGKYHRLVIDLNEGRYWAEVSDDKFYVPREAESAVDRRRREEEEAKQDEDDKRKAEKREEIAERRQLRVHAAASTRRRSRSATSGPSARASARSRRPRSSRCTLKKSSIKVSGVYTPRQTDEVVAGRAYIYFFPMGQTEPAIVHLTDPDGETTYSIVVHPLTGRTKIYNEYIKPPTGMQIDDEGTRIER